MMSRVENWGWLSETLGLRRFFKKIGIWPYGVNIININYMLIIG